MIALGGDSGTSDALGDAGLDIIVVGGRRASSVFSHGIESNARLHGKRNDGSKVSAKFVAMIVLIDKGGTVNI